MWRCDGDSLPDNLCFSRFHQQIRRLTKISFAISQVHLAYKLNLAIFPTIVMHFSIDINTIASFIIPHVHTKRFYPNLVGLYQRQRTEDAKRLTSFGESPFGGTSPTYPGRLHLIGWMFDNHIKIVIPIFQLVCNIKRISSSTNELFFIMVPVEHHCGIASHSFKK